MSQHRATSRELRMRSFLQNELHKRCERNPKYSLRAFAKALGMSHTNLSFILSGKRPISKKGYRDIIDALGLQPDQLQELQIQETSYDKNDGDDPLFEQITVDHQLFKSDWIHLAILSLMDIKNVNMHPKSIARIFGIQEIQARSALNRLKRLGYIHPHSGKWVRNRLSKKIEQLATRNSPKIFHENMLEKAKYAIENNAHDNARFSTSFIAIHPEMVPVLQELLGELEKQFKADVLGTSPATDVYALNINLFPLNLNQIK